MRLQTGSCDHKLPFEPDKSCLCPGLCPSLICWLIRISSCPGIVYGKDHLFLTTLQCRLRRKSRSRMLSPLLSPPGTCSSIIFQLQSPLPAFWECSFSPVECPHGSGTPVSGVGVTRESDCGFAGWHEPCPLHPPPGRHPPSFWVKAWVTGSLRHNPITVGTLPGA